MVEKGTAAEFIVLCKLSKETCVALNLKIIDNGICRMKGGVTDTSMVVSKEVAYHIYTYMNKTEVGTPWLPISIRRLTL